jgi:hypothetical protein
MKQSMRMPAALLAAVSVIVSTLLALSAATVRFA